MEEFYRDFKRRRKSASSSSSYSCLINNLDDGCLMHIFSFLAPIPDRYNTALVCQRWHFLACHPRLWLRVERSIKDLSEPGVFPSIEMAVSAARPGDTILISAGGNHLASNIQINKPLCLIGGGEIPDETMLFCTRGSERYVLSSCIACFVRVPEQHYYGDLQFCALEFLAPCKLANLTVKAELGCCLLHRSGRLTIDGCILQCETDPLDYLSCPIVSTAGAGDILSSVKTRADSVTVLQTRIEGGAKAVLTNGDLALQRVRVIYSRANVYFWFDVEHN